MHNYIFKVIIFGLIGIFCADCIAMQQIKPIEINQPLINKIAQIRKHESNANDILILLGQPAACLPLNEMPSEAWMCQWKGSMNSNRLENTLNITFEAGMIAKIIAIDKKGKYLVAKI